MDNEIDRLVRRAQYGDTSAREQLQRVFKPHIRRVLSRAIRARLPEITLALSSAEASPTASPYHPETNEACVSRLAARAVEILVDGVKPLVQERAASYADTTGPLCQETFIRVCASVAASVSLEIGGQFAINACPQNLRGATCS